MSKRKKIDSGRPWLLGTDDIPPPLRVPWQMWSESSDPHQQGLVQFEFSEQGLSVGWFPDGYLTKHVVPWHELAWMAGSEHPDLKTECQLITEKAEVEGYKLGKERSISEVRTKMLKFSNMAHDTDNPFLAKYAAALKSAIQELETVLQVQEK